MVHLPVGAQRDHPAVLVGLVGEHAFRGDLIVARGDEDVPDIGLFVAALIGIAEEELDFVGRGDGLVPERRNLIAAPVSVAFRVEMRWSDGILDDAVVVEHRQPGFFVSGDDGLPGAPAGLVRGVLIAHAFAFAGLSAPTTHMEKYCEPPP